MNLSNTKVLRMPIKVINEKKRNPEKLTEMEIFLLEEQEEKLVRMQDELKMKTNEISMLNRINIDEFYNYRKVV